MPAVWDLESMGKELANNTYYWTERMSNHTEHWLNDERRAFKRNNTELLNEIEN